MITDGRGKITVDIANKGSRFLGRVFTQKELRLYPYLSFCFLNNGKIEFTRTDKEEQAILQVLENAGHIKITERNANGTAKIYPTKQFYDFLNNILADGYVLFENEVN